MRKKIVAGNWKMNKTWPEAMQLVQEVIQVSHPSSVIKIIAPPFPYLNNVHELVKQRSDIFVAAQNCYSETSGAFTGEVSAEMIKSSGASYVIIGHSERRNYFSESNIVLTKKVDQAIQNNLSPVFCVGETLTERANENYFHVIRVQLEESLFHLNNNDFLKTVIAYEPVWAIGTGRTASAAQAQEMHAFIRLAVNEKYGPATAAAISILYGGSCNPKNARELFSCADVDGGLIGGASLKAADFIAIADSFS